MLNSNVEFKCWTQILNWNIDLKYWIEILNWNIELKFLIISNIDSFWNHVCFDRIYWSFWSCFQSTASISLVFAHVCQVSSPACATWCQPRVEARDLGSCLREGARWSKYLEMHWFWFTIFIQGELETETGWRAVPDNTLETLAEQFRYFGEHMINPLPLGTCCDFSFNDSFSASWRRLF